MRRKKKLYGIIILLMAIGFAAVATTLYMNGVTFISASGQFDGSVLFTEASISKDGFARITNGGKNIEFQTGNLQKINDEAILDYTVTNFSTQYDANVEILCESEDKSDEYLSINYSEMDFIAAGTSEDGNITIKLKKGVTEELNYNISCEIVATAVERDSVPLANPNFNTSWDDLIKGKTARLSTYELVKDDEDYYFDYYNYVYIMYNDNDLQIYTPFDRTTFNDSDYQLSVVNEDDFFVESNSTLYKFFEDNNIDPDDENFMQYVLDYCGYEEVPENDFELYLCIIGKNNIKNIAEENQVLSGTFNKNNIDETIILNLIDNEYLNPNYDYELTISYEDELYDFSIEAVKKRDANVEYYKPITGYDDDVYFNFLNYEYISNHLNKIDNLDREYIASYSINELNNNLDGLYDKYDSLIINFPILDKTDYYYMLKNEPDEFNSIKLDLNPETNIYESIFGDDDYKIKIKLYLTNIQFPNSKLNYTYNNSGEANLYNKVQSLSSNKTIKDLADNSYRTNTNGIYETTDTNSGNKVYFYRGIVDNYIVLNDNCYQIIRTTETNGTKIMYYGEADENGVCENTYFDDTLKVTSNTSYSSVINNWYKSNIVDRNLSSNVEDAEFCSMDASNIKVLIYWNDIKDIYRKLLYLSYNNLRDATLKCDAEGISSVSNNKMNYPVSLISADEIVYGGATTIYRSSSANISDDFKGYLWDTNISYLTLSTVDDDNVLFDNKLGLQKIKTNDIYYARPVISLKNNTLIYASGTGTKKNPYKVIIN